MNRARDAHPAEQQRAQAHEGEEAPEEADPVGEAPRLLLREGVPDASFVEDVVVPLANGPSLGDVGEPEKDLVSGEASHPQQLRAFERALGDVDAGPDRRLVRQVGREVFHGA